MERNEIIQKLTLISREVFQDDSLVLTDEMSASTVDAWTSLTFMLLLKSIEDQFDFKFKMLEILQLKTMGAIIKAIEEHT